MIMMTNNKDERKSRFLMTSDDQGGDDCDHQMIDQGGDDHDHQMIKEVMIVIFR